MSRLIRHHILSTQWVPWWLTGPNRGRLLWSVGATLDAAIMWAQRGMVERLPLNCSEEALPHHGTDKGIRKGFAESVESYRYRLTKWRQFQARKGHAYGVLEAIQAYFLPQVPTVRMVTSSLDWAQWWTRDGSGVESFHKADPSNWDWDSLEVVPGGNPLDAHRRFWIIIYQPNADPLSLFPALGTSAQQSGLLTRGTGGTVAAAGDLLYLANEFKMAGTWCSGIIIAHDAASFSPSGSGAGYPDGRWYRYADPTTWTPVRLATAEYFHDVHRPGLDSEI